MKPSSRTPEGQPNRCPVCNHQVRIDPSAPHGDAPCPHCGHLLWFPPVPELEKLDFIVPEAIVCGMDVATKAEAIETLVRRLSGAGSLPQEAIDDVIRGVMHREELGSTGIGRGFAVPHAKHWSVLRLIGTVGYVPAGIDFNSLDGEPVTTIVLLLSPPSQPSEHLRALERISRSFRTMPQAHR